MLKKAFYYLTLPFCWVIVALMSITNSILENERVKVNLLHDLELMEGLWSGKTSLEIKHVKDSED